MDSKQRQLANKYLDLLFRRKWFIIVMLMISLPIGLGVYLRTPKVYQAVSLLSYQEQKISPNKMSPDVASKIRDIVSTLTQIVTSRTNLEKLILDLKLYPESRQRLPMEDVVDSMRRQIKIEPSQQGDIFKIVFNHSSPEQVVKVTNALAAKLIEENLKYREEKASETSSYTSEELLMAKETMDRKENAMRDYKLQHYNEMPEQQVSNVSRLIALQGQYQSSQESIQDLERTCVLIQDQINNRKQLIENEKVNTVDTAQTKSGEPKEQPVSSEVQLAKMKLLLEQLLARYTEKHPDVKRTRTIIAKLEMEVGKDPRSDAAAGAGVDSSGKDIGKSKQPAERGVVDTLILQLETQYKNVLLNIESLKKEKEQLKKVIAEYEQWVGSAPVREAEWSALTREYGQLKKHYDYLVAQDLEAKSMLNLERRQKGSQFKIEDPARYPEKPIKPNFNMIMGVAAMVGLGLGVGLTLVLDFFDGSFRDPEALEAVLGIPLIATIPRIETLAEQRKRKWRRFIAFSFLFAGILLVLALFGVVWFKGYIAI